MPNPVAQADKYVEGYFKSRDLDKNGVLEGDELKRVVSKTKYDKNRDGKITRAEVLANALSSTMINDLTKAQSPSKSKGSRYNRSRTKSKVSSAFTKADANKDLLVQMHEFSKTWTKKKLDEFRAKDVNNDGVISAEEW